MHKLERCAGEREARADRGGTAIALPDRAPWSRARGAASVAAMARNDLNEPPKRAHSNNHSSCCADRDASTCSCVLILFLHNLAERRRLLQRRRSVGHYGLRAGGQFADSAAAFFRRSTSPCRIASRDVVSGAAKKLLVVADLKTLVAAVGLESHVSSLCRGTRTWIPSLASRSRKLLLLVQNSMLLRWASSEEFDLLPSFDCNDVASTLKLSIFPPRRFFAAFSSRFHV